MVVLANHQCFPSPVYFTGKKLDAETGLVYFGARYYIPKIGRFLTSDSIVQDPYNPQTLNRYTYCNNNPINLVDPTGHKWKWGNIFKAAAIAVVGAALVIATGGMAAAMGAFWGSVFTGALTGATIGGTVSAAMGGDIGQGMLFGAIENPGTQKSRDTLHFQMTARFWFDL